VDASLPAAGTMKVIDYPTEASAMAQLRPLAK
jgi:hypothetical protein